MAARPFLTLSEAAELTGLKYNTAARRASRFKRENPDTDLVQTQAPGPDGGRERVTVSIELVNTWQRGTSTGASAAASADRDDHDHLRADNEMLTQSNRHLEIQIQHLELQRRDEQIIALQAKVAQLEVDNAGLHQMLLTALSRHGT